MLPVLAGAALSACQVPNPAFGLETSPAPSTTDGASGTGVTDAEPTTSSGPSTDPGTSAGPGTSDPTGSSTTDPVDPSGDTIPPFVCGNGIPDRDEECDDGNQIDTDDCTSECHFAVCGDGFVHEGDEKCDDGNQDEDICTSLCAFPTCGDQILSNDEECDDGNVAGFDGCVDCQMTCGDGVFEPWKEECDPTAPKFAEGPLNGLCSQSCVIHACFRMTNTEQADIPGEAWFDACANAEGMRVAVLVRNKQSITYFAAGPKPPGWIWSPAQMTSKEPPEKQWKLGFHTYAVKIGDVLANQPPAMFDMFYAFGNTGAPLEADLDVCPSSLGDGYAVAVLPELNTEDARVLLMPHKGNSGARNLPGWDMAGPAIELAHAKGELMSLCDPNAPVQPFLGEIAIAVF